MLQRSHSPAGYGASSEQAAAGIRSYYSNSTSNLNNGMSSPSLSRYSRYNFNNCNNNNNNNNNTDCNGDIIGDFIIDSNHPLYSAIWEMYSDYSSGNIELNLTLTEAENLKNPKKSGLVHSKDLIIINPSKINLSSLQNQSDLVFEQFLVFQVLVCWITHFRVVQ